LIIGGWNQEKVKNQVKTTSKQLQKGKIRVKIEKKTSRIDKTRLIIP